jgi:16S rRNA (guanine1207-N2)-methyltransferase
MSRWAHDPEAAAEALIGRSLDALDLSGDILIAYAAAGLPARLGKGGIGFARWERRLDAAGSAQPWPPAGPFDLAILRLAKARDEQEMAVHAVLSVLRPEGRLVLYGGNDEGIRSAASWLGELCGAVETVARRGHGRVLAVRRPCRLANLRPALADWRRLSSLPIAGRARPWVTYPGIFATARIDAGTALLLETLPVMPAAARVADFGCGSGVIAAALRLGPDSEPALIDHDSVALIAAKENVPGGRAILASSLSGASAGPWDLILSNPPLHVGIAESHQTLQRLIAEAPAHLAPGGSLQLVLQRRLAVEQLLAQHLADVHLLADNGRYRVWRAHRG